MRRKKFKLLCLITVIALASIFIPFAVASAATTADVTVQATPSNIAITDNVTTLDFGYVQESVNTSSSENYIGITNTSNIQTDITVAVTSNTWSGGVTWTHSDTATAGADQAGLLANRDGTWGVGDIIIKYNSPNYIYENCPATTDFDYGIWLVTPTSFGDAVQKQIDVRIEASAG